jgi:multidrug efflux pump subunit AcrA (membrane-fusion protein)
MTKLVTKYLGPILTLLTITGCALLPDDSLRAAPQGLSGPTPTPIPTPIVPTKPVYEVQRGEVVKSSEFLGRVSPVVEEELFFNVSGRVRNLFIERDDVVTKGQILADLEIGDLERELIATQLELEQAQQELAQAQQNQADQLAHAKLELERAQAKLANAEQNHLNELARARINLKIKQIELAQAQNKDPNPQQIVAATDFMKARIALEKAQQAYNEIAYADDRGSSQEAVDLEQATLDYDHAKAAYDLALQEIADHNPELALLEQQVALAELEVKRLEEDGTGSELGLEVAAAQLDVDILNRGLDASYTNNVERAKLNVQKLEAAIADAQIIAPFAGHILSESLTAGQEVTAYKPVVVMADLNQLELSNNNLGASELSQLAQGMPVIATLSNRPGEEFTGTIRQLPYPYGGGSLETEAAESLADRSIRISLDPSPKELGLEVGDLMQVKVIIEQKQNVLWLPPQAIRNFEGREFVLIQDGEIQRRVDVSLGIRGAERVEIKSGLSAGQLVLGP